MINQRQSPSSADTAGREIAAAPVRPEIETGTTRIEPTPPDTTGVRSRTPRQSQQTASNNADQRNRPAQSPGRFARPLSATTARVNTERLACPQQNTTCEAALPELLADTRRTWIPKPATAKDYVSGARLIAFGRLRKRLTCRELVTGLEEAQTAVLALSAAIEDEKSLGRQPKRLEDVEAIAQQVRSGLEQTRTERC